MDTLTEIIKNTMLVYAGQGANAILYPLFDDQHQAYGLAVKTYPDRKRAAWLALWVRLVEGRVVIEEDRTDRPFVEALLEQDIPRENIILAYAGEGQFA
jgi:hypothetical protein